MAESPEKLVTTTRKVDIQQAQVVPEEPFYWRNDLSLILIHAYNVHKDKFTNVRFRSKVIWDMITEVVVRKMTEQSYSTFPNSKQCEGRWKTMTRIYRKTNDHNNKSGNDRRTCQFMAELDEVYGADRPNVRPVATSSSLGKGNAVQQIEENSENEDVEEGEELVLPKQAIRKRKYTSAATQSTQSVLLWLQSYEQRKEEREEAKMNRLEKMNDKKMSLFEKLIDKL